MKLKSSQSLHNITTQVSPYCPAFDKPVQVTLCCMFHGQVRILIVPEVRVALNDIRVRQARVDPELVFQKAMHFLKLDGTLICDLQRDNLRETAFARLENAGVRSFS